MYWMKDKNVFSIMVKMKKTISSKMSVFKSDLFNLCNGATQNINDHMVKFKEG